MTSIVLPNTQALSSPTFQAPRHALEAGNMTIPELYDWNATHNPHHPLFLFDDDGGTRTITWSQAVRMMHQAAHYVAGRAQLPSRDARRPPIVAVLASSDTVSYFCTMIGIMRAGFTVFAISPRNSPEAVAHLLSKTEAAFLLVSPDPSIMSLANSGLKILQSEGQAPPMSQMPGFEDLFSSATFDGFVPYPVVTYDMDSPALILHSSGSTAFPKAISWTYRALLQWCKIPWYGTVDLTSMIISCHAMPLYHGMGSLSLCYAPSCGFVMAVFKPRLPATFPTADNLFEAMVASHSDLVSCVPTFIEWSAEPAKVAYLKTMKGVMFGGGPLAKHAGDLLTSQNVKLYQVYGLTECSVVNVFLSDDPGMDWDYMRISKQVPHEFVPREEGTYELVVLATDSWRPRVTNSHHKGRDAYATSDLFVPHPTKSDLWRIYGRADDQIMLSTGEKTNPGPLEKILITDSRIQSAIMFGRGRFQNGILLEPKAQYAFDPQDNAKLREFRNNIWPTVERMNEFAPQHSRVFKEMILVASPSKPFSYTAKGTPRRQFVINYYQDEINALYGSAEEAAQAELPAVPRWHEEETMDFVRRIIKSVMSKQVGDYDDIFQFGCDSLQASWIRNKIIRALQASNAEAVERLPPNFVFRAPTVAGMTSLLLQTIHPSMDTPTEFTRVSELQATVTRYSSNFPLHSESSVARPDDGDIVFVTGTTGGFGCNILAQLSHDPTVRKVYAFNRPSDDIIPRQLYAMQKQGLLEDCFRASKFEMVEGDLSRPHFGLDPAVFEKLRSSVTHIIHNAWPVDFNLTIKSFERSLQGVRSLIEFALSSPFTAPPQILFVSSIGVFRQPDSFAPRKEEPVRDPAVAAGTGYAESKWVAEQILALATERTGLRTVSVRIGQLCGDRNGHWNEKEWFPSIVKSALYVGCLPDVPEPGLVSWVPSYDGAKAIVAMRNSDEPILHLVNPNPVPWRTFLAPLAQALNVPLLPYDQWLHRLGKCLHDTSLTEVAHLKRNPALRLLDYYRDLELDDDMEPLGVVRLDTTKSVRVAPSLLEMPLSQDFAVRWLASWRHSGFIPDEGLRGEVVAGK